MDRNSIYNYIESRNPGAAIALDQEFERKAQLLTRHPYLGRPGTSPLTRELVIRPNYILYYTISDSRISITRIRHAAQQLR